MANPPIIRPLKTGNTVFHTLFGTDIDPFDLPEAILAPLLQGRVLSR